MFGMYLVRSVNNEVEKCDIWVTPVPLDSFNGKQEIIVEKFNLVVLHRMIGWIDMNQVPQLCIHRIGIIKSH